MLVQSHCDPFKISPLSYYMAQNKLEIILRFSGAKLSLESMQVFLTHHMWWYEPSVDNYTSAAKLRRQRDRDSRIRHVLPRSNEWMIATVESLLKRILVSLP